MIHRYPYTSWIGSYKILSVQFPQHVKSNPADGLSDSNPNSISRQQNNTSPASQSTLSDCSYTLLHLVTLSYIEIPIDIHDPHPALISYNTHQALPYVPDLVVVMQQLDMLVDDGLRVCVPVDCLNISSGDPLSHYVYKGEES